MLPRQQAVQQIRQSIRRRVNSWLWLIFDLFLFYGWTMIRMQFILPLAYVGNGLDVHQTTIGSIDSLVANIWMLILLAHFSYVVLRMLAAGVLATPFIWEAVIQHKIFQSHVQEQTAALMAQRLTQPLSPTFSEKAKRDARLGDDGEWISEDSSLETASTVIDTRLEDHTMQTEQ